MSIQAPQGILNIPNATLRVGKLAVDSTAGFDTVFNNVERNTILLVDSTEYEDTKQWDLKMPNIFVATFEIKGAGSSFNFRNTSNGDATVGYTLTFSGTTLTLKYDDSVPILATATIPNLDTTYGKVYLTYEKQYFTVTVDGTRVLAYKDDVTRTPPDGEYINFFAGTETPGFQNLKVVAGHLISDGTSNVSLYGGLAVTSNLEVGQANLFVDTTTSRVGVGTTEPDASLHVTGNAYITSNLEVGSSNLFVDTLNTRVGVGTTEPKEALDVVGNMHLTRVSNVSQIKVDSNVVTEYTGPHDRPLRKYPEVAMTANDNLSASGYVASRSSGSTTYDAWKCFNGTIGADDWDNWLSDGKYDTSDGDAIEESGANEAATTTVSGTAVRGEWVQLKLPKKIRLKDVALAPMMFAGTQYATGRTPTKGVVAGSIDGTNWELVKSFTASGLQSFPQNYYATSIGSFNSDKYYDYFRLIIEEVTGGTNGDRVALGEVCFYGYEEGSGSLDTTLKSVYNVPATTGTQLEVYYDGRETSSYSGSGTNVNDLAGTQQNGTLNGGVGFDTTYKAFTFDGSGDYIRTSTLPSVFENDPNLTQSVWVYFNELSFTRSSGSDFNSVLVINASGQYNIGTINELGVGPDGIVYHSSGARGIKTSNPIVSDNWYHITVTKTPGNTGNETQKIYINGVLVPQVPWNASGTQVIGANPFLTIGGSGQSPPDQQVKGSIANFRLYSKALNADQVKELYDYQKDYFLGSKSQVTLYKGHLGVGVTEPSGQLELAGDERIQEYPPRGLTGYETLVEGHGVFTVYSTGGLYNNGAAGNIPWTVFNKITGSFNDGTSWVSEDAAGAGAGGNYNTGGSSGYGGSNRLASNTPLGDYLVICLPYPIALNSYSLSSISGATGYGAADFPRDYIIYGSSDSVNWEVVDSRSDQEAGGLAPAAHVSAGYLGYTNNYKVPENNKVYSKFAIVITDINAKTWYDYNSSINASYTGISEWRLFGTPGPTTLDKGSLTLGRSLDVPRISRYDVDTETPRPEKLVVDFDTTVNSSPTDISGQGNHGVFKGTNMNYSSADKAFVFNGTDDYIKLDTGLTGNVVHSISMWIKAKADLATGNVDVLFYWGGSGSGNHRVEVLIEDDEINYNFANNDYAVTFPVNTLVDDRWYHLVFTYNGVGGASGREVYIDGVQQTGSHTGSTDVLALASSDLYLSGNYAQSVGYFFSGLISNFKLYSVALEPSEVKKLYNLGRTGRSMVISDTAVGIGKVPEAQLDVRGVANFERVGIGTTNPTCPLDVRGTIYAPGTIVQVQHNSGDSLLNYSSSANASSGDIPLSSATGLKLSITPTKTTSKVHVNLNVLAYFTINDSSSNGVRMQVWRKIGTTYTRVYGRGGSTHDLHWYKGGVTGNPHVFLNISFVDSPNTVLACEYELRAMLYTTPPENASLYIGNSGNQPATITLMEIGGE
jgi:hypothetical protein